MVILVMAHGSMVTWLQADLEQVILVIHHNWGVTGIISTMSICVAVLSFAEFLVALQLSHDLKICILIFQNIDLIESRV